MKKKEEQPSVRDMLLLGTSSEVTAVIDLLLAKNVLTKEELIQAMDCRREEIKTKAKEIGLEVEVKEERPNYFG